MIEKVDEWHVYIIQTTVGTFYTGITKDLKRRFAEHQNQQKGASFFRLAAPEKMVYCEVHANRSEASKRECAIKKMSRSQKQALVDSK